MVRFYSNDTLVTSSTTSGDWNTIGSYTNYSDDRIKSHEVEILNATDTLNKLTPKIYDKHPFVRFPEDQEDNDLSGVVVVFKESGFIAQEVLNNAPELDHLVKKPKDIDGLYGLNYVGLIPYLVKSNKELNEKITALTTRIETLEKI